MTPQAHRQVEKKFFGAKMATSENFQFHMHIIKKMFFPSTFSIIFAVNIKI